MQIDLSLITLQSLLESKNWNKLDSFYDYIKELIGHHNAFYHLDYIYGDSLLKRGEKGKALVIFKRVQSFDSTYRLTKSKISECH
jgi:hypothetical protein